MLIFKCLDVKMVGNKKEMHVNLLSNIDSDINEISINSDEIISISLDQTYCQVILITEVMAIILI